MSIVPVHGQPALFAGEISTLFIADLHIGLEHEILLAGARIPPKTGEMLERLLKILKETKARTLVIAGDLKHNIPVSSFHEEREIPRLVEALLEVVEEVHLTPGNHDGSISRYLPGDVKLHSNKGFVLGDYGIWHGHCWPSEEVMASRTVIMGHVHPNAAFVDGVGGRSAERCWVRGLWDYKVASKRYATLGEGFIILPAFNDLCGGSRVNDPGQRKIGAVLRNGLADILRSELFLLDGTGLGRMGDNLAPMHSGSRGR